MRLELEVLLNSLHLEDLCNPNHPSQFIETEAYSVLILRLPTIKNEDFEAKNYGFVLIANDIYQYDFENASFSLLASKIEDLYKHIDRLVDEAIALLDGYISQVDSLEDRLYERKLSGLFVDYWFDLKKDMSRMQRIFEKTADVCKEFLRAQHLSLDMSIRFEDIVEHLERSVRSATFQQTRLDTLYNYFSSLKNDRINKNIYTLTVLSAIFLPLNLVVGFFGMNTQGLFLSNISNGTSIVFLLLCGLFLFLLVGIPLVQKIEKYVIARLLGRYDFYKTLSKEIKKVTTFETYK